MRFIHGRGTSPRPPGGMQRRATGRGRQNRLHDPLTRKSAAKLGREACRIKRFAACRGNSTASLGRQAVFLVRQAEFFEKVTVNRAPIYRITGVVGGIIHVFSRRPGATSGRILEKCLMPDPGPGGRAEKENPPRILLSGPPAGVFGRVARTPEGAANLSGRTGNVLRCAGNVAGALENAPGWGACADRVHKTLGRLQKGTLQSKPGALAKNYQTCHDAGSGKLHCPPSVTIARSRRVGQNPRSSAVGP
jgi:hypothetical protein